MRDEKAISMPMQGQRRAMAWAGAGESPRPPGTFDAARYRDLCLLIQIVSAGRRFAAVRWLYARARNWRLEMRVGRTIGTESFFHLLCWFHSCLHRWPTLGTARQVKTWRCSI